MKTCSKCKEVKDGSNFTKNRCRPDGLSSYCKTCNSIYSKKHYDLNKDAKRKYALDNAEHIRQIHRANYLKNIDDRKAKWKEYYGNNAEKIIKQRYEYKKSKLQTDSFFHFKEGVRSLISTAYRKKSFSKNTKTYHILGCTFEQLFEHLKQTAINNYGGWHARISYHIDHILPIASAKTEEDILKLNHYTNLQYLTVEDNLKKGKKNDWHPAR